MYAFIFSTINWLSLLLGNKNVSMVVYGATLYFRAYKSRGTNSNSIILIG